MDELELQKVLAKKLFRSADDAAVDALNSIKDPSREMGGVIYRSPDNYYRYTDPTGSKQRDHFEITVAFPKNAKGEAIYHSHPQFDKGDSMAEYFSGDDIKSAHDLKMLSYIKALQSGNIRKYEDGKSAVDKLPNRHERVSYGQLLTPMKE